jgi:hypothetical protein
MAANSFLDPCRIDCRSLGDCGVSAGATATRHAPSTLHREQPREGGPNCSLATSSAAYATPSWDQEGGLPPTSRASVRQRPPWVGSSLCCGTMGPACGGRSGKRTGEHGYQDKFSGDPQQEPCVVDTVHDCQFGIDRVGRPNVLWTQEAGGSRLGWVNNYAHVFACHSEGARVRRGGGGRIEARAFFGRLPAAPHLAAFGTCDDLPRRLARNQQHNHQRNACKPKRAAIAGRGIWSRS